MKLFCLAGLVLVLMATPMWAQDAPKGEVFGGYQFTHIEGVNANGWNASASGNFNKWFGVTGDFSGAYKSMGGVSVKLYTYTFGPTISFRKNEHVTPFVHALFGGFHASGSGFGYGGSTNGFAMFVGGGVDANVNKHIAVRLAQVDWEGLRASGSWSTKDVRYSAGVVFRF